MPIHVSAAVTVVASTKATPGFPVSPHSFGGEMEWKGSATTSDFQQASPGRIPDAERTSSGAKRKSNFLEIDLNVAERLADEPLLVKQLPASSSLASEDSCVEVISRGTEK